MNTAYCGAIKLTLKRKCYLLNYSSLRELCLWRCIKNKLIRHNMDSWNAMIYWLLQSYPTQLKKKKHKYSFSIAENLIKLYVDVFEYLWTNFYKCFHRGTYIFQFRWWITWPLFIGNKVPLGELSSTALLHAFKECKRLNDE